MGAMSLTEGGRGASHSAPDVLMSPCPGFNNRANTGACSDQLVPGAGQGGARAELRRSREAGGRGEPATTCSDHWEGSGVACV